MGLSISGKFDAMNAEFDPEKNKVEVVVTPRYELTDAVAYLKPVNEMKNTSRPELFAVTYDGVTLGTIVTWQGLLPERHGVLRERQGDGRCGLAGGCVRQCRCGGDDHQIRRDADGPSL